VDENRVGFVHEIGPCVVLVYMIESNTCGLDRQCRYVESPAVGRNSEDARGDEKPNVLEPTEFLHHSVDLQGVRPPRIKNGFRIIEHYENFLGG